MQTRVAGSKTRLHGAIGSISGSRSSGNICGSYDTGRTQGTEQQRRRRVVVLFMYHVPVQAFHGGSDGVAAMTALLVQFGDDGIFMGTTAPSIDTDSMSVLAAVDANVGQWQHSTPTLPSM